MRVWLVKFIRFSVVAVVVVVVLVYVMVAIVMGVFGSVPGSESWYSLLFVMDLLFMGELVISFEYLVFDFGGGS